MRMAVYEVEPARPDAPPLDDAEAPLWRSWRESGDEAARARLLDRHLPYARLVAGSYYARRHHDEIEFDEYLQLASLGLIEAMSRFDPERGVQFRTFAARRMHGAIVDGIQQATEKQRQIAVRQRMEAQRAASIRGEGDASYDADEGTPAAKTTEQLLRYVAEAGLAFALSWMLDGTGMIDAEDRTEHIPFYRSIELRELREQLLDRVGKLPAQERGVIRSHYLQEMSFEAIADRLGLSRGRVSQIHRKALARLREGLSESAACDVLA